MRSTNFHVRALSIAGAVLFWCGCANKPAVDQWAGPRIFAIGYTPSLSFNKERPLVIPIEGLSLVTDSSYEVDVTITGTVQPRPFDPATDDEEKADYYFNTRPDRTNPDKLSIILQPEYLKHIKTGDTLNVAVHIRQQAPQTRESLANNKVREELRAIADLRKAIETANEHWQAAITHAPQNALNSSMTG